MTELRGYPRARRLAAALAGCLALAGCAPKSWVVLLPNEDGSTGRIIVTGPGGEAEVARAGQAATLDTSVPKTFDASEQQIQETFGGALAAQPALPTVFRLYFELGGTQLTPESVALLPSVLNEVAGRPGADISIVGHTDTAGRAADNEALGLERATFVRDRIVEAGLRLDRISTESHGEGNPLVPTADDVSEPRNRRVEIVVR
ncbi:MAG: OmpA family protein [Rhodocyclaceae bacterium]|nr:OmpA family protein [Rhodocyclaceae bacterium]